MIRMSLSGSEKSVDFVLQWYEAANRTLRRQLTFERNASSQPEEASVFFGLDANGVEEFFAELEYLTMLDILSATEAALRVDFWRRVNQRMKDPLSRAFRETVKRHDDRISLERHILANWACERTGLKSSVADFRGALKLRHWLAHGRYWTPKLSRQTYAPADVYDVCDSLLRGVDLK